VDCLQGARLLTSISLVPVLFGSMPTTITTKRRFFCQPSDPNMSCQLSLNPPAILHTPGWFSRSKSAHVV